MKEISFRPMRDCEDDYRLIVKWYGDEEVRKWFCPALDDVEAARKKYLPQNLSARR